MANDISRPDTQVRPYEKMPLFGDLRLMFTSPNLSF